MDRHKLDERIEKLFTKHDSIIDRPITAYDNDLFDREAFVQTIALQTSRWIGQEDSLIISIDGQWGSGKSSLKELIKNTISKTGSPPPIIVEFNPWEWAQQGKITEAFFAVIASELAQRGGGCDKKLARGFRKLGEYFNTGSSLLSQIKDACISLVGICGLAGATGWLAKSSPLMKLAAITAVFLALTILVFTVMGLAFKTIATRFHKNVIDGDQPFRNVKKVFTQTLAKDMNTNLVVVIDEIDRLPKEELKAIFQLLKANVNLPNLVYLLFFQHDIVEESLKEFYPSGSRNFLDKIIQLQYTIPHPERTTLDKIVLSGVKHLIDGVKATDTYDEDQLKEMLISGCRLYFQTLRDVKRFLSTLATHFQLYYLDGIFQVNPIDLFGLEILRMFEPRLFQSLPRAKFALTDAFIGDIVGESSVESRRAAIDQVLANAEESTRPLAQALLILLFPKIESLLKNKTFSVQNNQRDMRLQLRVRHAKIFDRYFTRAIPADQISEAELQQIKEIASDRSELYKIWTRLIATGRIAVAFDQLRFDVHVQQLTANAEPFITSLFDIGDELSKFPREYLEMTTTDYASLVVLEVLKSISAVAERKAILHRAISETEGTFLPAIVISLQDQSVYGERGSSRYIIPEGECAELRGLCLQKIIQAAKNGRIINLMQNSLLELLEIWQRWNAEYTPNEWLEEASKDPDILLSILEAYLNTSPDPEISIDLQRLTKLMPAGLIDQRLSQIDMTKRVESEQRTVEEYRRSVSAFDKRRLEELIKDVRM